ncbi:Bug family tripartite tricarboxylate transporter substrate binding protein [Alicycliphilus denitrificans]|uniref:Bug family tripartite tricarboxylate transporter substrate binding protein n=1 Tax=Alicycliphilus denitrificans TaxID=179636 RepID=UPI003850B003
MLKRLSIAMSALMCLAVHAAYPERPIQIVVPYSAGGIADIMARRIANELTTTLKTSVVVQNKGGGSAIIGTQAVAKAAPDGYTILFTPNTPLSINPLLRKKLPYDPAKDLEILSILAETPIVVVARPQLGLKSLRDMAALARTKPGGLNYSAVSAPGPLTLPMNKLQNELRFDMTPVPYQGAGEAMNAVLAGNVDISINALGTALPYITSGKVTALAVGTDERLKDMPGVETIGATVPGMKTSMWYSLSVPAGVPQDVRNTLQKAFEGLRQSKNIREAFARDHLVIPAPRTSAELQKFLADDLQRWKKVIDDSGIQPN